MGAGEGRGGEGRSGAGRGGMGQDRTVSGEISRGGV